MVRRVAEAVGAFAFYAGLRVWDGLHSERADSGGKERRETTSDRLRLPSGSRNKTMPSADNKVPLCLRRAIASTVQYNKLRWLLPYIMVV